MLDEEDDDDQQEQDAGDEPAGHGGCAEPAGPQRGWVMAAWCLDPAGNGHVDRWSRLAAHNGAEADPERRRADRAEIITQKRAWKAATAVRRDWLAQFATRRTATKGSGLWVAAMLAKGRHPARRAMESGYPLARQLLTGRTDPVPHGTSPLAGVLDGATEGRAAHISLVVLLAAHEEVLPADSWRRVNPDATRYLRRLVDLGYSLSEVEQRAAGQVPDPDAKPDTHRGTRPGDRDADYPSDD